MKKYIQVCLAVLLAVSAVAQQEGSDEKVILYNSAPVSVELNNEGEIVRFIEDRPEYMRGFVLDTPSDASTLAVNSNPEQAKSETSIDDRSFLLFEAGSQTFDGQSLDLLNRAITRLRANPNISISLQAAPSADPSQTALSEARLQSCKKYLSSQGIATNRIQSSTSTDNAYLNRIIITYIQ